MSLVTPVSRESLIWSVAANLAVADGKVVQPHASLGPTIQRADRDYLVTLFEEARRIVDGK